MESTIALRSNLRRSHRPPSVRETSNSRKLDKLPRLSVSRNCRRWRTPLQLRHQIEVSPEGVKENPVRSRSATKEGVTLVSLHRPYLRSGKSTDRSKCFDASVAPTEVSKRDSPTSVGLKRRCSFCTEIACSGRPCLGMLRCKRELSQITTLFETQLARSNLHRSDTPEYVQPVSNHRCVGLTND